MLYKTNNVENLDVRYYCDNKVNIGDAIFEKNTLECFPYKYAKIGSRLIGISLDTIDDNKDIGKKISILTKGVLMYNLEYFGIPKGQEIYLDNDGKPTWRKSCIFLGKAYNNQCKDGYLMIEIDL